MAEDPKIWAIQPGGSDEDGQVGGVVPEPVMPEPTSSVTVAGLIDGDDVTTKPSGERRPDPPEECR
jgi:hypothetical protein